MKLHLPKQLFTALLSVITLATPATLTLGSTAWGVTSVTTDTTWSGGTSSDADKAGITIDGAEAHLKITDGEYKSETEKLELKNAGQLTMSGGTLNTLQIHVHNANASTTETLTLTGGTINVSKANTSADNASAVLIGHWPSGTGKVLVQGGTLNALNGFVTTGWNSHGILEISGTGVVNAKGVALRRHTDSYVKLNGGRLNVGGSGIVTHNQTSSNPGNLQFLSGTLGTLSDSGWSLGSNITATIGSIIIDTDVWDATTGATATGDAAGSANISLLGELTAASDSASITLAGSGSLTIDHTWDGTIVKASDTTTAKVLIDTGNVAGFDKVLSGGYGNTQASGFATYQIFKSGSTASVYSTANTDNALSLTDGAYSSSDFHVCDTVNYSDITATVSRFYVQQGGTLTLGALGTTTVNDTTKYYIPAPIHNAGNVTLATSTEGVTTYLNDLFGDAAITQTSTGTTTISGTGAVSMNDAVTLAGKVVISGGSFTNNGKNLNGGTGGTLVLQNIANATLSGQESVNVNVEVGSGATLSLATTDTFNWSSGNKLTVQTGGKVNVGSYRHSLSSSFEVIMAGGTIEGQGGTQGGYLYGLDFYSGGTIRATENSTINTAVGGSQSNGSITVNVDSNKTLTFEGQYAKFSGSKAISKTGAGNVLYKGASFTNALTISGGVFEYYMEDTRAHSGSISGAGTFKKSGSGTLKVNGTIGTAEASMGSITVSGGNMEVLNTSYAGAVSIAGGNLTYGGTGVTHTITGAVTTVEGSGNSTFTVSDGSTVNVGSFDNAWGASMVIDGSLVASGAISFASNSTETISGTGSISASSLAVTNHSNYQVSTQQLTIGKDGLTLGNPEGSWGTEHGTLSLAGETATINGATNIKTSESALNLNAGSTTIAGAVTNSGSINVKGGSATLNGGISGSGIVALSGGSLALGSGEGITNEIAQFNYSGGTLTHSGLTVTNATFSGGTLVNTGALTLNGTLNIENQSALTESGTASYSDGDNGFYRGSYYVIKSDGETGTSLTLGEEGFVLQLMGTAVSDSNTSGANYWSKDGAGNLLLTIQDNSGAYYVNKNTVTVGGSSATAGVEPASAFHVASGAKLDIAELPTGWTAAELLAGKVTGAGTLLISQSGLATGNANLTTTFGGTLELAKGVTFTLGAAAAGSSGDSKEIVTTSLASVVLNAGATAADGSKLQYHANGNSTLTNLTVNALSENEKGTATLNYVDSNAANAVTLAGTTQLNGNLNVTTVYDGGLDVEHLSGAGAFSVTGSSSSGNFNVTIQSLQGYSGSLSFSDAELSANVSTGTSEIITMGSITASGVREFTFNVDTNTSLDSLTATNSTVNLATGTTLTLGQTGADAQETTSSIGTVNVASGAGTIYLNEKASLEAITKTGEGTLTLNGSGTYTLASGASSLGTGVVLGADNNDGWTGTVAVSDTTQTNDNGEVFAFASGYNTLFNTTSTLQVTNAKGYLQGTLTANLNLVNGNGGFAMQLANGSTGSSYEAEFSGSITGSGNIVYVWEKYSGEYATTHIFSNDTSTWKGQFIRDIDRYNADNAKGKVTNVHFTHGGNVFSAADDSNGGVIDMDNSGRLNVTIAAGSTKTIFNGTLENIATVTVNSVTDFTKDATTNKLVVANEQTATLTGASNSITAGNVKISQKNASLSNVTVQSGSIAATSTADGAKGSISGALVEMQSATSFSISDMVLSNVKLSAVEGASVALNNVSATNTLLAGGGDFTLNATPTVEVAANDTTTGRISYTCGLGVESGSSLTLNLDVINAVRPDQHGTYDLSITLSGFGSNFVIEDNAILGMVKFDASSWLAQALEEQGAEWHAQITEATENTVVTQSSVPTVTYSAGTGENVGSLVITINGLNVPEPTTATLSLLALAALAARRRRK